MTSHGARREKILEAAERLFRHYGPGKTTIGDIAREVGIGVGSVYLEFCSKDDIVAELAHARRRRILGAMRAAARRGDSGARLALALEARIQCLFELSEQGAHSCDLMICSGPSKRGAPQAFQEDELAFIEELLAEGARAKELSCSNPAETARLIQRAYISFSPPWLFEQERREVLRLVRALNDLILDGLRARTSRSR